MALFEEGGVNNMNDFIGRTILSMVIQVAIARFYPPSIIDWQWWVVTLPVTVIIQLTITSLTEQS